MALDLGDQWWFNILSDDTEHLFDGPSSERAATLFPGTASAPAGAAPAPAAEPAGGASATPAGSTTERRSARIRQRVAPSRPRFEEELHATSRRPSCRRRGPEPAAELAADNAATLSEPAAAAAAFQSIQDRPSARARVMGNGHKGRAPKSQAFPWKDAHDRALELKAMWKAGQLTQAVRGSQHTALSLHTKLEDWQGDCHMPVCPRPTKFAPMILAAHQPALLAPPPTLLPQAVADILSREFNNDRISHGTVSRHFAE